MNNVFLFYEEMSQKVTVDEPETRFCAPEWQLISYTR